MMKIFEERNSASVFALQALCCVVVFLALIPAPRQDGHLISSDGARYYSYLRSLIVDHDVDIGNDLGVYNERMPAGSASRAGMGMAYAFAIGTPVLWAPAYIPAHYCAALLNLAGIPVALDGFSYLEEGAVCIANILYMFAGLLLIYKTLRFYFPHAIALTSVLLLTAGSSIIDYALLETWMSHSGEVFSVGLFLWFILVKGGSTHGGWFVAGLLLGLVFLVRWQNVVFAASLVLLLRRDHVGFTTIASLPRLMRLLLLCALGFTLAAFPQFLFWKITLGSWALVPQGAGWIGTSNFHLIEVLASTRHGMFVWTPLILLGTIGVFFLKDPAMRWVFAGIIALELLVCSSMWQWWAGESFGMRRMIGATPLFMFGYAALLDRLQGNRRRALLALSAVFVVWTVALFVLYAMKWIPRDGYLN